MKMEVATTSQKTSSTFGRGKKKSSSTALAVVTATGCSYFSVQLLNYMPHVVEGAQLGKTKKKSLLAMNKQGVAQKSREAKKNQKTKKNLRAQTSKETLRPISSGSVPAAAPWTNLITTATAAPLTNICMNANYMSSGSIDEIEIQIQIILLCISILFPGRLWSSDWTIARITTVSRANLSGSGKVALVLRVSHS
ncbi:unnamed protein product [Amoebophrya sp. A120]|nr:unnamed protein product [Amoebophrya sp. A120]|eukprot:GSA120T00009735001.1